MENYERRIEGAEKALEGMREVIEKNARPFIDFMKLKFNESENSGFTSETTEDFMSIECDYFKISYGTNTHTCSDIINFEINLNDEYKLRDTYTFKSQVEYGYELVSFFRTNIKKSILPVEVVYPLDNDTLVKVFIEICDDQGFDYLEELEVESEYKSMF